MGTKPPLRAFARMTMSGCNIEVLRRQKPSRCGTFPFALRRARTKCHSACTATAPASGNPETVSGYRLPTGSARRGRRRISWSGVFPPQRRYRQKGPASVCGSSGPNPPLQKSLSINERAPQVRPWKAPCAYSKPSRPVTARENLMAASTPSLPELAKKTLFSPPPAKSAETLGQFTSQLRYMALQHRRAAAVQFVFQRVDNARMVVARIVNAVSGKKIEIAVTVFRPQLRSQTALVMHIHVQQIQQSDPLRIDVLCISRRGRDSR